MDSNQNKIISQKNIFVNEFGRLRDVVSGPDGYLYMLTSNNDGRGSQTGTDDRILKILPISKHKNEFIDSSPLKQFQNGVKPRDIACKENLVLVLKIKNDFPACISPSTAQKLQDRGWGHRITN